MALERTMNIFSVTLLTFAIALMIHVAYWKIRIPHKQTFSLLKIFLSVWLISSISLWSEGKTPVFLLHYFIAYWSFMAAYIVTYSALEVDSPSLVIVRKIDEAGEKGFAADEFDSFANDDLLIRPRLRDLLRDNLAKVDGDRYVITPHGEKLVRIFIVFRRTLGLPKGG